jgi:uncharacterized DUF497 family protein
MAELRFEWDPKKNRENQRDHKVSFEEAETAFADEHGRLMAETRITRKTKTGLFFISARKADRSERTQYSRRWRR